MRYRRALARLGLTLTAAELAVAGPVVATRADADPSPAQAALVSGTPTPSAGANGRVNAIAHIGDRIYLGGSFTAVGGQPRGGLAALDAASGQLVASWRADVAGVVQALAPSPDGTTLYVGGEFSAVGGAARKRLAAVSASTGGVGAWDPGAKGGTVLALAAAGGRIYVGGKFSSIGTVARPYLAAVSTSAAVLGWDAHAGGGVWALGLDPGGTLYAGGAFQSIGGRAQPFLASLSSSTGEATGWHPRVTCPGLGIALASGTVYLACGGDSLNGDDSVHAFSASSAAELWHAGSDGNIHAVAALDGAVYAGGHFTTVNGVVRKKAAALDAAGGQLLGWDPHPDSVLGVFSMLAAGDWLWVGGDFTTVGGTAQPHIARFERSAAVLGQSAVRRSTLSGPPAAGPHRLRSTPLPSPTRKGRAVTRGSR